MQGPPIKKRPGIVANPGAMFESGLAALPKSHGGTRPDDDPGAQFESGLADWKKQSGGFKPEDEPGYPSRAMRLMAEFGRGTEGGLTFDLSKGSQDTSLNPEGSGFRAEDVAHAAGEILGSLPLALLTGGAATAGARVAGEQLAARAVAAEAAGDAVAASRAGNAAKVMEFLSQRAPEDATMKLKMLRSAGQNVYQGLAFTAASSGTRAIADGQVNARTIARDFGVAAGADFMLGVVTPYVHAHVGTLIKRLKGSPNSIDRDIADELMNRLEGNINIQEPSSTPTRGFEAATETPGQLVELHNPNDRTRALSYDQPSAAIGTGYEDAVAGQPAPPADAAAPPPAENYGVPQRGRFYPPPETPTEPPRVDVTEPMSQASVAWDRALRVSAPRRFAEEQAMRARLAALQGDVPQAPPPIYDARGEVLSAPPTPAPQPEPVPAVQEPAPSRARTRAAKLAPKEAPAASAPADAIQPPTPGLASKEERKGLSKRAQEHVDLLEKANTPGEVAAVAANAAADPKLREDDKAALQDIILRKLDQVQKARSAAIEAPPPRPTEPTSGGESAGAIPKFGKSADRASARGMNDELRTTRTEFAARTEAPPVAPELVAEHEGRQVWKQGETYSVLEKKGKSAEVLQSGISDEAVAREIAGMPAETVPSDVSEKETIPGAEGPKPAPELPTAQPGPEPVVPGEWPAAVQGKETQIKFADGSAVQARYRVVEANDIQTSHNPETFQPNPRYPDGVQERPYHRDIASQEQVVATAQKLDPDVVLDATQRATEGPAFSTPDAMALSGNQRTMAIKRAYGAGQGDAYKEALIARAPDFGLDPEAVRSMKHPVLDRELIDSGVDFTNRDQLRDLGERANVATTKSKDVLADAVTRARKLDRGSTALPHLEATIEPDQTVRDYLGNAHGKKFVENLIEDGVIAKQEALRFRDPATGVPTPEGRELIERTLQVAAVGDADVVARAPAAALNKLEHATPAIIKANTVEGFNISVALRDALNLLAEARANGATLRDVIAQSDIFAGARNDSPYAVKLAQFIEESSKRDVAKAFRAFADDAAGSQTGFGADIFGEPVRDATTAFAAHFGKVDALPENLGEKVAGTLLGDGTELRHSLGLPALKEALEGAPALTKEVTATIGRVEKATESSAHDVTKVLSRVFRRGVSWMETLGTHGQKFAGEIREVDQAASKRAKNNALDIGNELKGLRKHQREQVAKIINGRILEADAPADLLLRARRVREVLDRDMNEFANLGGKRLVGGGYVTPTGSGAAFPQVPNDAGRLMLEDAKTKGLASPSVAAQARKMVRDGEAVDLQDALNRLLQYHSDRLRGVNRYLERTRFKLPDDMVEWDPNNVLPITLERNARTIEGIRKWGQKLKGADVQIGRIANESDPGNAKPIREFIGANFGLGGLVESADTRLAGAIGNYETLAKLGFSVLSVLRNMGQRFTNVAEYPLSVQARAVKDLPPFLAPWLKSSRAITEQIERTGAVRSQTALANVENTSPGHHLTSVAVSGFSHVEHGNQTFAALVARYGVEHDMNTLARMQGETGTLRRVLNSMTSLALDPEGAITRRLNRRGLDDETIRKLITSGQRLSPDQIETAMFRMVSDTQFPLSLSTERLWWSTHPWMRLAAKFKTFGVEQTSYIYNNVLKEAVKGNAAPLVRFVGATMLMGEMYNVARDLITGHEESVTVSTAKDEKQRNPKAIAGRLMKNIADGGGVGMLTDLVYGVGGWLGGPAGSTLDNARHLLTSVALNSRDAGTAGAEFLKKEISISRQAIPLANRLDRAFGTQNNTYFEHVKWRQRAFQFAEAQNTPTGDSKVAHAVVRVLNGQPTFEPTENTLSFTYAARAVTAGDTAGAREYLTRVLADAVSPRELGETIQGIRRSMQAQSPLGPVPEKDRGLFLRQFSASDRQEASRVERKWLTEYQRAFRGALSAARSKR